MKKIVYAIGLITAISISLGWLFKITQYPGGQELFVYGFLGFVLLFLPMLAVDRYKVILNTILSERLKFILGFVSAFLTGLSVIFKVLHFQGAEKLLIVGILTFSFGFLPFLFYSMYLKSTE